MTDDNIPGTERVEQVGPDRVTISDQGVVIEAKRAMPDWQVRELNPAPVYFGDKKYYLAEQRRFAGKYAVRYVLRPWPDGQSTSSKLFYTYDAEAVAERDAAFRSGQVENLAYAFLLPFYPLLGLLWSGTQRKLGRFGVLPRTMSALSIYTCFALLFSQGVFAVITIQATVRSGKMLVGGLISALSPAGALQLGGLKIPLGWFDILLTAALLADVAVRYSLYLREDQWIGGFLEWLVRRAPEPEADTTHTVKQGSLPVPAGEQASADSREHYRFLARLGFWLPAAVLPLCAMVILTVRQSGGPKAGMLLASCGWLLGLTLVAGSGLTFAGLSGIGRHGSRGILGPGIRGLVLNGVLGAIFISGFVHGFHSAFLVARARETTREVNSDLRRDLVRPGGVTNSIEVRQAGVEKLRSALDKISENGSGDTALIAKVSSAHLAKMQVLMTNYAAALKAVNTPPLLDMSGVTNRQQLVVKKELARKFLAANDNLQAFISKWTETYRDELSASGVAPGELASSLAGFEKSTAVQKPLLIKIRDDDRTMGNGMLAMLDILDSNWGKWTYNRERKKVDFDDMATLDKYVSCRDSMQSAARDQQRQQLKLASLMN